MADCEAARCRAPSAAGFAVLLGQGSEFAFVVFGAAQMADVLDSDWAALTLAVALSMAATPILLVLLTRLEKSSTAARNAKRMRLMKSSRG